MKLLLILLPFTLLASDDFFSEIKSIDQKEALQKIRKYKNERKLTYAEKEAMKVRKENILKSPLMLVAIKEGGIIVHSRTQKFYLAPKEMVVKVYQKRDFDGYRYIKSKNDDVTYKVRTEDTSILKNILTMSELPHHFEPVKKKVSFNLVNKEFRYSLLTTLSSGLAKSSYTTGIIAGAAPTAAVSKVNMTALGNWKFPIQVGLGLQYENQRFSQSGSNINYYSLSFGPDFFFPKFDLLISDLQTFTSVRVGVYSALQATQAAETVEYDTSQTSISLGFLKEFANFYGKFHWGIEFQREWIKVKLNSSTQTRNTLYASLTHRFDL